MRYMLTLSAVHDDTLDGADIENAATDVWGELYVTDDADPVEYAAAGAVVLDQAGIVNTLAALTVGSQHPNPDIADMLAGVVASLEAALGRLA